MRFRKNSLSQLKKIYTGISIIQSKSKKHIVNVHKIDFLKIQTDNFFVVYLNKILNDTVTSWE